MTTDTELYRVFKCRYKSCGNMWVASSLIKDPRCIMCGGATPYSSLALPETIALRHLSSIDTKSKKLEAPIATIAAEALTMLTVRSSSNRQWAEEHTQMLRYIYESIKYV